MKFYTKFFTQSPLCDTIEEAVNHYLMEVAQFGADVPDSVEVYSVDSFNVYVDAEQWENIKKQSDGVLEKQRENAKAFIQMMQGDGDE
jgi:hypothetical protein